MPVPGEAFAHYELLEVLTRPDGSSTDAFRATDTRTGATVVVELTKSDVTSVQKARFGVRARRLAAAQHPCLITVLEATATHCVLEAPEGTPLSEHAGIAIARARQKLAWLSQIASSLVVLHRAGVVHGQLGLEGILVLPDHAVKLVVPLGGEVGGTPLDDVRAFAHAACELVLGPTAVSEVEETIAMRLHDAGLPKDAAAVIARVTAGASMTSEDLAQRLAPHAEIIGPTTEPLLRAMRRPT